MAFLSAEELDITIAVVRENKNWPTIPHVRAYDRRSIFWEGVSGDIDHAESLPLSAMSAIRKRGGPGERRDLGRELPSTAKPLQKPHAPEN